MLVIICFYSSFLQDTLFCYCYLLLLPDEGSLCGCKVSNIYKCMDSLSFALLLAFLRELSKYLCISVLLSQILLQ